MPITTSAKKALRQSVRRKVRNLKRKGTLKDLVKQERKLASLGNAKEAKELLPKLYQALDKAAKRGIIKKNAASRRKSRLTKLAEKSGGK
ncbi:MAG: 30S ribosomal protein S20 [bacterium]|nr:30S ribosomal protein S20 [bacterium]